MSSELYSMNEGDAIGLGPEWEVLRVPGGWIYTRFCETGAGGFNGSSTFVPFDNEFQPSSVCKHLVGNVCMNHDDCECYGGEL